MVNIVFSANFHKETTLKNVITVSFHYNSLFTAFPPMCCFITKSKPLRKTSVKLPCFLCGI